MLAQKFRQTYHCSVMQYSSPNAMEKSEDNTSDIEAAVEARLKTWSTPLDEPASSMKSTENDQTLKRRRVKKRRRSQGSRDKNKCNSEVGMAIPTNATEPEGIRNHRLLEQALVRPKSRNAEDRRNTSTTKTRSSSEVKPVVVKAKDIAPSRRNASDGRKPKQSPSAAQPLSNSESKIVDASDYVDQHRREVGRFGSKALGKRDRKSFEAAELLRLGCREPKKEKMPIGLLTGLRKRQKLRAARKKEMDIASGMLVRSKRRG